jgi:hypothetical protein
MWLLALAVAVAACSGGGGTDVPDDPGNGASSPEAAVSELLGHLKLGEFGEAVPLAIPGQAVLASLAEGATVEDVANGLRDGDELIVNNFWSGFAQTVEPFLIDTPELAGSEPVETQGVSFDVVTVRSTGGERTFTTRDVEGHRVDIFATFGPSSRLQGEQQEAAAVLGSGLGQQLVPQPRRVEKRAGNEMLGRRDLRQLAERRGYH